MCGRFGATFPFREIKIHWNVQNELFFEPRYNIAPSQAVPVIVREGQGNRARSMRWGLVPSWAPDPSIAHRMINARSETLLQKSPFKDLLQRRRCVIPADGFYEWRRESRRKIPMWIHWKNREPFAFAGLWDSWQDRRQGQTLHTFTIITTQPNKFMRGIHDRMPVMLGTEMGQRWLDQRADPAADLISMLEACPSDRMEAYEVSSLVNSPGNDRIECIQPLPAGYVPRGQLPLW